MGEPRAHGTLNHARGSEGLCCVRVRGHSSPSSPLSPRNAPLAVAARPLLFFFPADAEERGVLADLDALPTATAGAGAGAGGGGRVGAGAGAAGEEEVGVGDGGLGGLVARHRHAPPEGLGQLALCRWCLFGEI